MFFPISPSPPSGMIRIPVTRASLTGWVRGALRGNEHAEPFEAVPDALLLVLVRLDQRQPEPAHLVPEDVERGLDRDRVRLHLQQLVRRGHRLVHALCLDVVALLVEPDHLLDLRAADVRVDADAADAAELEEREDEVVVTR